LTGGSRAAANRPLTSFPLGTEVRRQALWPCTAGRRSRKDPGQYALGGLSDRRM